MKLRKFISTAMAACACMLFAQQEPGAAQAAPAAATPAVVPEAQVVTQATPPSATEVIQNQINAFLASKGWTEGENKTKDGRPFNIIVGQADIMAPAGSVNYGQARVNAFNAAMLRAKESLASQLEILIRTQTELDYREGAAANAIAEDSELISKAKGIINGQLKKELPADATAEQVRAKLTQDYAKMIHAAATAYVQGIQAAKVLEYAPAGEKGVIAVVAIWSPVLHRMSEIIVTGGRAPAVMPKAPIASQLPTDPAVLLSTFGVQQKVDENGQLVLVSFGQSTAVSKSAAAVNGARQKALLNARATIAEFVGEELSVLDGALNSESAAEFENGGADYSNANAFQQRIQAATKELKIQGIQTVRSWQTTHPVSGQVTYGVICTWSADSAATARARKAKMDAGRNLVPGSEIAPPPPAQPAVQPQAPAKPKTPAGTYQGSGAAADEDAF